MNANTNANPFASIPDELERLAQEEFVKRRRFDQRVSVLIFPADRPAGALQLAQMGAYVTLADNPALQRDCEGRALAAGLRDQIAFTPMQLPELPAAFAGEPFDIIICRRSLCGLPYAEARQVVRQLMQRLKIGGKLFISVLGMHSELGEGYAGSERPIEERYGLLSPAIAQKYCIDHPVCLYTERNLFLLLLEAGASVLRTLTTTYGNVKGVAVRV